jgi:hypothetical protein
VAAYLSNHTCPQCCHESGDDQSDHSHDAAIRGAPHAASEAEVHAEFFDLFRIVNIDTEDGKDFLYGTIRGFLSVRTFVNVRWASTHFGFSCDLCGGEFYSFITQHAY